MTSLDEVQLGQFLATVEFLRDQVLAEFPRATSFEELLFLVNSRDVPREGIVGNSIHFEIHGVGGRFWTDGGAEIDVDLSDDGLEMFDAWRYRLYLRSLDYPDLPSTEEIEVFLSEQARLGELRVVSPGWYVVGKSAARL
jgi:hypothetical protein